MDGLVVVLVAVQAIALAMAPGIAWSRGRTLEALAQSLREADAAAPGVETAVPGVGSATPSASAFDAEDLSDRLRRRRRLADEGPGVPPLDRAPIFERFYKAHRTRTAGGGTGLGLAIARHIVEGNRGTIRVDSDADKGATSAFTSPVSDALANPFGPERGPAVHAGAAGG